MIYTEYLPTVIQRLHDSIFDFYPKDGFDFYYIAILPSCMLILCVLMAIRDMIFVQISCWIPHIWVSAYEEFSHDYCWIDGTFFLYMNGTYPSAGNQEKGRNKIAYYQWMALFVTALYMLLIFPRYLWRSACGNCGLSISHLLRLFVKTNNCGHKIHKDNCIANILEALFKLNAQNNTHNLHPPSSILVFVGYMGFKILNIILSLMVLWFLKWFINMDSVFFVLTLLKGYNEGVYWPDTGIFPLRTFCTVPIRQGSTVMNRTIQCVLPYNVMNSKVAITIWLMFAFGIVLMIISIVWWLIDILVPSQRVAYVSGLLKMSSRMNWDKLNNLEDKKENIYRFTKDFLGIGETFMLKLIEKIVTKSTMAGIIEMLWKHWFDNVRQYSDENVKMFQKMETTF